MEEWSLDLPRVNTNILPFIFSCFFIISARRCSWSFWGERLLMSFKNDVVRVFGLGVINISINTIHS